MEMGSGDGRVDGEGETVGIEVFRQRSLSEDPEWR